MTIATKNGVPIIKDGSIATGCGCCGGWYCYGYNQGCFDTDLITRASKWACGEGNEPPDSISVRVTFSGESLTVWRPLNCDEKGCSFARQVTVEADASNNFEATLFRKIDNFPSRYGSYHCYYKETTQYGLEIHPGAACGDGWDAGLAEDFLRINPTQSPVGDPIPIAEFNNPHPGVYQPPAACDAITGYKGAFPSYGNFSQQLRAIWSNLPCQTQPNAALQGFSWTVCRYVSEAWGVGQYSGTYLLPMTVATVEVI